MKKNISHRGDGCHRRAHSDNRHKNIHKKAVSIINVTSPAICRSRASAAIGCSAATRLKRPFCSRVRIIPLMCFAIQTTSATECNATILLKTITYTESRAAVETAEVHYTGAALLKDSSDNSV